MARRPVEVVDEEDLAVGSGQIKRVDAQPTVDDEQLQESMAFFDPIKVHAAMKDLGWDLDSRLSVLIDIAQSDNVDPKDRMDAWERLRKLERENLLLAGRMQIISAEHRQVIEGKGTVVARLTAASLMGDVGQRAASALGLDALPMLEQTDQAEKPELKGEQSDGKSRPDGDAPRRRTIRGQRVGGAGRRRPVDGDGGPEPESGAVDGAGGDRRTAPSAGDAGRPRRGGTGGAGSGGQRRGQGSGPRGIGRPTAGGETETESSAARAEARTRKYSRKRRKKASQEAAGTPEAGGVQRSTGGGTVGAREATGRGCEDETETRDHGGDSFSATARAADTEIDDVDGAGGSLSADDWEKLDGEEAGLDEEAEDGGFGAVDEALGHRPPKRGTAIGICKRLRPTD